LTNIAGIIFASMFVFSMMHLYVARTAAKKAVEKEELAVKKEQEKAEKEQLQDSEAK
jgi:hypothetical protein